MRVMRTAKRMGIATVTVYSDADARSPHVLTADESVWLRPAPAAESYLKVELILLAAKKTEADCIHPGYGFLSKCADFARACAEAGVTFIGPPPEAIGATLDAGFETSLANACFAQRNAGRTEDFITGIDAFREKRPAAFRGR